MWVKSKERNSSSRLKCARKTAPNLRSVLSAGRSVLYRHRTASPFGQQRRKRAGPVPGSDCGELPGSAPLGTRTSPPPSHTGVGSGYSRPRRGGGPLGEPRPPPGAAAARGSARAACRSLSDSVAAPPPARWEIFRRRPVSFSAPRPEEVVHRASHKPLLKPLLKLTPSSPRPDLFPPRALGDRHAPLLGGPLRGEALLPPLPHPFAEIRTSASKKRTSSPGEKQTPATDFSPFPLFSKPHHFRGNKDLDLRRGEGTLLGLSFYSLLSTWALSWLEKGGMEG